MNQSMETSYRDKQDETYFSDIEFKNGEFLFVYSDKFNITFFFRDNVEKELYKITTDKYLMIDSIEEVKVPKDFFDAKKVKFFRPALNNNSTVYKGIAVFDNISKKFSINDYGDLSYFETTEYIDNSSLKNMVSCLEKIDVEFYIQKKDRIYLVGYDEEYQNYIYGVVDVVNDRFERIYSLFSDKGDIIPLALNTDVIQRKIYVVGKTELLDDNDQVIGTEAFFESFNLI